MSRKTAALPRMPDGFDPPSAALIQPDPVNHPAHYTSSPAVCGECGAGIECIQIVEHMGFNPGNAVKYLWRADLKGAAIQDLEKARWYVDREIQRRKKQPPA